MEAWNKVKWTDARQITDAMDLEEHLRPGEGVAPESFFAERMNAGELEFAVSFLAHALPRFEAVAWAAKLLERRAKRVPLKSRDRNALDHVLRWLEEPKDDYRRAAMNAAENASEDSAEQLLGMSVFFSGGSIAPADLPPVNPQQELCGRMAASAVIVAAHENGKAEAAFREALELGTAIASRGLDELQA